MTSSIKLSIVFLNFNKLTETKFTCTALQELCINRDDIEIIAVDNNSKDGTAEYLQTQAHITSILLSTNDGIAGYSAGFDIAQGEFILVLDDDSSPVDLKGIDTALETFDLHSDIGIIAAHIQSPDGSAQWSWHLPKSKYLARSPFFIGCGFIIRRDLFARIDWYPKDFFLYQNEIDVSFQIRLLGYDIFYQPDFVVVHRGIPSQRAGWRRIFYPTRNTLWLLRQYYPQPLLSYMIFSRVLIGLIRAISFHEIKPFFKALKIGLFAPVKKTILPSSVRKDCAVFFYQNSLIHQLFNTMGVKIGIKLAARNSQT